MRLQVVPAAIDACLRELVADVPELAGEVWVMRAGLLQVPREVDARLAGPAWAALVARGLVPAIGPHFIERSHRRCRACADDRHEEGWCGVCCGTRQEIVDVRRAHPPTMSAAVGLAIRAATLGVIEELAREAVTRLWPWRGHRGKPPPPGEPPSVIAWRVAHERPAALVRETRAVCPFLFEALYRAAVIHRREELRPLLERMCAPHSPWTPGSFHPLPEPSWTAEPDADRIGLSLYESLVAADATVPTTGLLGGLPASVPRGQAFVELANPFVPLCTLWDRGVAVERIEADAIVLALLVGDSRVWL
ncbi:MAG TPA: hypothetical protein VIK91_11540 [Nannocystis sp.]